MIVKYLLLLALSLVTTYGKSAKKQDSCKALVMSGGGSNGAWEMGVLWGLTHYGDPEQYKYDVVTGVSIGSINAALLALWKKGSEVQATEYISKMWQEIKTENIYEHWLSESFFGTHIDIISVAYGLWK